MPENAHVGGPSRQQGDERSEAPRRDFQALREELVPLPTSEGHRKVLLLGTTGAGKTTVVRQLLGTDPETERFPSTSPAKTTVADTELITTADGPYRAAVTFTPRDEVTDYLAENVCEATLAAVAGKSDHEIAVRLLDHVNQRFRFSYVLGRPEAPDADDLVDDDDDDDDGYESDGVDPAEYGDVDLAATARILREATRDVRTLADIYSAHVREELQPADGEENVLAEYIEENLDPDIRGIDGFDDIVEALLGEIEKRFALLNTGEVCRDGRGWPVTWSWSSTDRAAFIKVVTRFSSNYAPLFGRLLTPLVNGVRVKGPFRPIWAHEPTNLILLDGEGLGHTPQSAATLSTRVAAQLEAVDAVVLVDNAMQPMQAAPVAALKGLAVSGSSAKLHLMFTHFDRVEGDNLPRFSDREQHVLASVENVLKAVQEDLGSSAERGIRRRIEKARYFVGEINKPLNEKRKTGARSIVQFNALLEELRRADDLQEQGPGRPVYDRTRLRSAVGVAAKDFHAKWRGLLGFELNPDAPGQHWARVKALSRRLGEGWSDEYAELKPVADLRYELQKHLYLVVQRPDRWEGGIPDADDQEAAFDETMNALTRRLIELAKRRVKEDAGPLWRHAFEQRGQGSTRVRARVIADDIYGEAVPESAGTAAPERNELVQDVVRAVTEAAEETGAVLR